MILGIGLDLVRVSRVETILARDGGAFEHRLLSDEERKELPVREGRASDIAKAFAAKEALLKSLGLGLFDFPLTDLRILPGPDGKMAVKLMGHLAEIAGRRGVRDVHIDTAGGGGWVAAFVLVEGGE